MSINVFRDQRTKLVSFKMFPVLTEYKNVGLRNFTMAGDIERKLDAATNIAVNNNSISLGDVVENDLNMVTLENNANGVLEIDGGVSATRYQFTLVIDETRMSGNIERVFIRGYTSAIELIMGNGGMFSRAIPEDALFYVDSYTSVTYAKRLNGNGYVASSNTNADNILSNNENNGLKTTLRPRDVMMSNYVDQTMDSNLFNNATNILSNRVNVVSNFSNNNSSMYTRTMINSFMRGVSEEAYGYGYSSDGLSDKSTVIRSATAGCMERSVTDIPVLNKLVTELSSNKISILTVNDLRKILNTYTLDGIVEVFDHDMNDVAGNAITMADVDLLGADTITVGVHDLYNNIQPLIVDSGQMDLTIGVVVDYSDMLEPFKVAISNYNSFYDDDMALRKLNTLKNVLHNLCLSSFDKYLRFDEEVIRCGGYAVEINFKYFLDTVITLHIGEECMIFRFPNFAGSQFTPVVTNDQRNIKLQGIGQTMNYFTENVLNTRVN